MTKRGASRDDGVRPKSNEYMSGPADGGQGARPVTRTRPRAAVGGIFVSAGRLCTACPHVHADIHRKSTLVNCHDVS